MVWHQYKGDGSIFVLDDVHNNHKYRNEVVRYLDLIGTTYFGKVLFRYCNRYSGRRIEIRPYVPTPADPVDAKTSHAGPDAYLPGVPVSDQHGHAIIGPHGALSLGTGRGQNPTIRYHPATFRQYNENMHWIPPGSGPGEMLFHELVHAMRQVHGVFLRTAVPENPDMGNFEEFCAIANANILYRSERGFHIMRDSWMGFHPLQKSLDDAELFYDWYKKEFKAWFDTQRDYCMALARSHAVFNPFKFAAEDLGLMAAPQTPMALPPR